MYTVKPRHSRPNLWSHCDLCVVMLIGEDLSTYSNKIESFF